MKDIQEKKDIHLIRKIWHMLPGLIISYIIYFNAFNQLLLSILLGLLACTTYFFELIRLNNKKINMMAIKTTKLIIRKEELKEISGVPYYLFASFLVSFFFQKEIAALSILYLAIGDPVASFFGIKFASIIILSEISFFIS